MLVAFAKQNQLGLKPNWFFSWSMQTEEASRMLNPSFRAAVSWAGWSDIDEKAELRWKISFFVR